MRNLFVAALFVSSVLLNAQQVTKGSSDSLLAHNDHAAAAATTDVASAPRERRISTGITGPKLISEPGLRVSKADFGAKIPTTEQAVVSFKVDEKGTPQNVHLLKSVNQEVDQRVLAAVRQYRYEPAKLDDESVPMDVNLVINFQ